MAAYPLLAKQATIRLVYRILIVVLIYTSGIYLFPEWRQKEQLCPLLPADLWNVTVEIEWFLAH